jgi:hypothetical protein
MSTIDITVEGITDTMGITDIMDTTDTTGATLF